MGSRVPCEVRGTDVEFKGKTIPGVELTCTACGHVETVGGESDRSVKRGLCQMRDNCPCGSGNFYITDEE